MRLTKAQGSLHKQSVLSFVAFIHKVWPHTKVHDKQWCSQNAEKVMHIKGRLLDQTMILYNYAPFQNGNFSKRKELAPRGSESFPLGVVLKGMENHIYHIGGLP